MTAHSASRAVPLPAVGTVTFDPTLTRQWRGRIARLWAAQPAYLPAEAPGEPAVFVDDAPVGTRVRIQEMYRTGPLNADIRALASPERTADPAPVEHPASQCLAETASLSQTLREVIRDNHGYHGSTT